MPYRLDFHIIGRMASRKTQYNRRDVQRVADSLGWETYKEELGSALVMVRRTFATKDEAIAGRTAIEAALRLLHRNVGYRFTVQEIEASTPTQ